MVECSEEKAWWLLKVEVEAFKERVGSWIETKWDIGGSSVVDIGCCCRWACSIHLCVFLQYRVAGNVVLMPIADRLEVPPFICRLRSMDKTLGRDLNVRHTCRIKFTSLDRMDEVCVEGVSVRQEASPDVSSCSRLIACGLMRS